MIKLIPAFLIGLLVATQVYGIISHLLSLLPKV